MCLFCILDYYKKIEMCIYKKVKQLRLSQGVGPNTPLQ